MNIELINKLWERTELKDKHWLWKGTLLNGYGGVYIDKRKYKVGRLILSIIHKLNYKDYSWQACHIDLLCKNKHCWNPLHLYVGTASDNNFDRVKDGKNQNANKEFCKWGHEFTPENTYIDPRTGIRYCKKCRYRRKAQWNERNRIKKQRN